MRSNRASLTAAFVATCRGLSRLLPEDARLVDDPYGAELSHHALGVAIDAASKLPRGARVALWGPLALALPWALYMQVRTRSIDDVVRAAVADGCDQVVILGAGLDARAVRLADVLRDVTVFEVDHPATQRHKREGIERLGAVSPARYLAWDFERDSIADLADALSRLGHDRARRTITLWEGVTMYLSREAIDATLDAVRSYSAPGSRLVFNYIDRDLIERPNPLRKVVSSVVRVAGEPFTTGFDPSELPAVLGRAGFDVERDAPFSELARELLPHTWSEWIRDGGHLAIATRR